MFASNGIKFRSDALCHDFGDIPPSTPRPVSRRLARGAKRRKDLVWSVCHSRFAADDVLLEREPQLALGELVPAFEN